jgi:hypothetical protein
MKPAEVAAELQPLILHPRAAEEVVGVHPRPAAVDADGVLSGLDHP